MDFGQSCSSHSSTLYLDHFFRAGLCKLHQSGEVAHSAFNVYCEEYPSFFETREAQMLAELITAVKGLLFRFKLLNLVLLFSHSS